MKKIILFALAFSLFFSAGNAQSWKAGRVKFTAGPGITQIFGDIGGYSRGENFIGLKDMTYRHTGLTISAGSEYRLSERFSARAGLAFGSFHSTDARGSNMRRGFESSCIFIEPSVTGKFYVVTNKEGSGYRTLKQNGNSRPFPRFLNYYIFTGAGGLSYHVNPNQALESRVAGTRGFTAVIPAGIGVELNYSQSIDLSLELSGRYSFSDDIDGYTSKYSKANDVYYFLNFIVAYKTGKQK